MTDRPTRSHENELIIAAPPQDIWRALTDAEELSRWFAVAAEVEPGEGGSLRVSWDESPVQAYGVIAIWEPLRRLRVVHDHARADEKVTLAEDFEIEALEGGSCRVRIVASGFLTDESWDGEFEGTKNGWAVFLRNLRHYLEHHRGQPCTTVGLPWQSNLGRAEAFAQVFGPAGVLAIASEGELVEGRSLALQTSWGEALDATVDMARGDAMLGLVIGDMLLRTEIVQFESGLFVHVMLLAWGDARAGVDALAGRLRDAITPRLGATADA